MQMYLVILHLQVPNVVPLASYTGLAALDVTWCYFISKFLIFVPLTSYTKLAALDLTWWYLISKFLILSL
jgi:hypothetical protein